MEISEEAKPDAQVRIVAAFAARYSIQKTLLEK
jgi:hypothetical protein